MFGSFCSACAKTAVKTASSGAVHRLRSVIFTSWPIRSEALEAAHSHGAPANSPSAPRVPAHHGVFIHGGGLVVLGGELVRGPRLCIRLILCRSADISLVVRGVRINVEGLPGFLDHRD